MGEQRRPLPGVEVPGLRTAVEAELGLEAFQHSPGDHPARAFPVRAREEGGVGTPVARVDERFGAPDDAQDPGVDGRGGENTQRGSLRVSESSNHAPQ